MKPSCLLALMLVVLASLCQLSAAEFGTCRPGSGPRCGAAQTLPNGLSFGARGGQRTLLQAADGGDSVNAKVQPDSATEPQTQITFPTQFQPQGYNQNLPLVGTGVQQKNIFGYNLKVSAVAYYLDVAGLPPTLAWRGRSADDLCGDADFVQALGSAPVEKYAIVTFNKDVDRGTFTGEMNDKLTPRLRQRGASDEEIANIESKLSAAYTQNKFYQGSALVLGYKMPASLTVSLVDNVNGPDGYNAQGSQTEVDSQALVNAAFDLSPTDESPTLTRDICNTLSKIQ